MQLVELVVLTLDMLTLCAASLWWTYLLVACIHAFEYSSRSLSLGGPWDLCGVQLILTCKHAEPMIASK